MNNIQMNYFETLQSFLKNHQVFHDTYSHVSSYNPTGKFQINRCDTDMFWELYCNYIQEEEKGSGKCGLMEVSSDHLPILVDFDIKIEPYKVTHKKCLYTSNDIRQIIDIYYKCIEELIPTIQKNNLICVVLEKPSYMTKDNKYIKNGFHLHFPNVYLSKSDHFCYLLPLVQEKLSNTSFSESYINKDCLDAAYCKNPWLLYGSCKNEMSGVYKMTYIYNNEFNPLKITEFVKSCPIFDTCSKQIDITNNEQWWIPRILSISNYHNRIFEIKKSIDRYIKIDNICSERHKSIFNHNISLNIEQVEKFVHMLDPIRSEQFDLWMEVGWCLFNITTGSKDGLQLWMTFSKKCPEKYNESRCCYEWSKMEKGNYTIASLKYWAKKDNTDLYIAYTNEIIDISLSGTDFGIAKCFYETYNDKFVCASISKKIWFTFEGHKWIKKDCGSAVDVRMYMSTKFLTLYKVYLDKLKSKLKELEELSEEEENDELSVLKNKIKFVSDICIKLQMSNYKSTLLKECSDFFYHKNFLELLDTNEYLIAFKNGIYDLKLHTFRKGKFDDYISMEMGISYNDRLTEESDEVQDIILFFKKIFPNENIRNYFLYSIAELFIGGNKDKVFHIWSGAGDNGKSVTQKMIELLFNKYSVKFPTSVVIGKRSQSGAATPELARNGNGVRVAFLQEPDHSDQLNMGMVKELTGNDSMYVRPLYEEGREMIPMFKLILVCNEPPKINDMGRAAWNRPRIIPFESTFLSYGFPDTLEEQIEYKIFPKDTRLMEKIPEMIEALGWYLLFILKNKPKPDIPKEVIMATNQYKNKNDVFTQFINDKLKKEDGSLLIDEVYSEFKDWYKNNVQTSNIPTKISFVENMSHVSLLGKPKNNSWTGIKFHFQS